MRLTKVTGLVVDLYRKLYSLQALNIYEIEGLRVVGK